MRRSGLGIRFQLTAAIVIMTLAGIGLIGLLSVKIVERSALFGRGLEGSRDNRFHAYWPCREYCPQIRLSARRPRREVRFSRRHRIIYIRRRLVQRRGREGTEKRAGRMALRSGLSGFRTQPR